MTISNQELLEKKCIPCEGPGEGSRRGTSAGIASGTLPMTSEQAHEYLAQTLGWELEPAGKKIRKEFKFKDFKESMAFVNTVAEIAETEGHHPDMYIFYSQVRLELWTHSIGGLSENDFILAAKINQL